MSTFSAWPSFLLTWISVTWILDLLFCFRLLFSFFSIFSFFCLDGVISVVFFPWLLILSTVYCILLLSPFIKFFVSAILVFSSKMSFHLLLFYICLLRHFVFICFRHICSYSFRCFYDGHFKICQIILTSFSSLVYHLLIVFFIQVRIFLVLV